MDEDMQAIDAGNLELERRFDSFARARLSPDPRATARIRARVMREARLHQDAARIALHMAPTVAASQRLAVRRLAMPFLAAAVWLSIAVGSIAAAQAGGPLYPTRLWIEAATLPSTAGARIDADLQRMDERLAEALSAAASGDRGAVFAALNAYAQIAEDANVTSGSDAGLLSKVEEALGQHQAVLTAVAARLADKGNDNAADAIELNIQRAIEHNAAVLQTLATHHPSGAGTPINAGGSDGSGGTGAGSGGSSGDGTGGTTTGGANGGNGGAPASVEPGGNGGAGGGGPDKPAVTPKPTHAPPDHSPPGQDH